MMNAEELKIRIMNEDSIDNCPVTKTLELLSGRWTSRIIYELIKYGTVRFGELKKHLNGITNTMLSATLKTLEEKQIIVRKQYDEMPVRVEYSLTEIGRDMLPIFNEMLLWGSKNLK